MENGTDLRTLSGQDTEGGTEAMLYLDLIRIVSAVIRSGHPKYESLGHVAAQIRTRFLGRYYPHRMGIGCTLAAVKAPELT